MKLSSGETVGIFSPLPPPSPPSPLPPPPPPPPLFSFLLLLFLPSSTSLLSSLLSRHIWLSGWVQRSPHLRTTPPLGYLKAQSMAFIEAPLFET